jgi:hypothetical protein
MDLKLTMTPEVHYVVLMFYDVVLEYYVTELTCFCTLILKLIASFE